jgi:uncharacterized protein (DUF1810 family)
MVTRFIVPYISAWPNVHTEMIAGKKQTHWMWFVFPQLKELGLSTTARYYGIVDRTEAIEYSNDLVLGDGLRLLCSILLESDKSAIEIFGEIDAEKLRSCLTLFSQVAPEYPVYQECLFKFFELSDERTINLLT